MTRRILGWTCGVAAILAAALVVGCGRDANAPAPGVGTAAAPRLAEGAQVRTTLRDAVVVPGQGAEESVTDVGTSAAEAVMAHRRAVDARTGTPLAAEPGAWASRELSSTDDSGHTHRIVVGNPPGGPLQTVRYERDGAVVAEVTYRWDVREGGYVLRERVLSLLRNGRVVLRLAREASPAEVTPGPAASAAADGGIGRPAVLPMQVEEARCIKEWATYIGASAALIVAGEIYLVAPNPATAGALVAAAGAWEKSLNSLLACQAAGVLAL